MGLVTCVIITSPFSIFSKALVLETTFRNFRSLQTHTVMEQNLIGKYDTGTYKHTHTHTVFAKTFIPEVPRLRG